MFGEIVLLYGFLSMGFLLSWRRDGFVQYEAVEASSAFLVFYSVKRWITWRFENFLKILYQQWCTYNWFIMEFVIPFTTNKKHWQWVSFLSFVHHAIILLLILCKIVLKRLYNIKRIAYYILKSFFPATMSIRLAEVWFLQTKISVTFSVFVRKWNDGKHVSGVHFIAFDFFFGLSHDSIQN